MIDFIQKAIDINDAISEGMHIGILSVHPNGHKALKNLLINRSMCFATAEYIEENGIEEYQKLLKENKENKE